MVGPTHAAEAATVKHTNDTRSGIVILIRWCFDDLGGELNAIM
jgi:hypothetical protein